MYVTTLKISTKVLTGQKIKLTNNVHISTQRNLHVIDRIIYNLSAPLYRKTIHTNYISDVHTFTEHIHVIC